MAALALCGTAFAMTYDLANDGAVSELNSNDTLVVNATPTFNAGFSIYDESNITLEFRGANYIKVVGLCNLDLEIASNLHITADQTAKDYWEGQLTSSAGLNYVPLAIRMDEGTFYTPNSGNDVDFLGKTSGPVTLGSTEFAYVGLFRVLADSDIAFVNDAIGDNNGVALVLFNHDDKVGLYLAGKGTAAATPEPATATLSLMALAGLCARRRRH